MLRADSSPLILCRLWASSGQSALENASILVINGTATAASTLKNLVLPGRLLQLGPPISRLIIEHLSPGIGKYTILDSKLVDGSDIGNNFFLESSSLGKSRAEEVSRLLQELNSDVKGAAVVQVSSIEVTILPACSSIAWPPGSGHDLDRRTRFLHQLFIDHRCRL